MNDSLISDFQILIVGSISDVATPDGEEAPFVVNRHSRGSGAVIDRINDLEGIWDQVIMKLTGLAAKSQVAALASQFELDEIEFNVGIEAGLSVGLVTKGNASVSIKFSRKKTDG